jgi:N utilization substance protein A
MSQLDMSEAVRMLANEKNISVDALLQVLADALALAYKRRPGAAEATRRRARRPPSSS